MNRKGFTLIELLGVIVILSILMLIAIPNISATLERSKRDQYIVDAKKMISLVEYEIRKEGIDKPKSGDGVLVRLSKLSTSDLEKDADGNSYDTTNSYVVITRKNGYLKYYINLVSTNGSKKSGISLVDSERLDDDDRYTLVSGTVSTLTTNQIKSVSGVTGTLQEI